MSRADIFDKLEYLILDEEKVVTTKVLSREFKIHVNEARQYLLDFKATQKAKENLVLEACYLLAGTQKVNGVKSVKVLVVSEKLLQKFKKKLLEVTSCHIYSISKHIADDVRLSNIDHSYNQTSHEDTKVLVIKHPKIEKKTPIISKTNSKKSDNKPSIKPQQTEVSKNVSSNSKENVKEEKLTKIKVEQVEIQKPEKSATTEVKKPNVEAKPQKPNTLASLWQKNEDKSKGQAAKTEGKGKTKSPPESKKAPPKNNIMSMFSKQAEKNAGSSVKKTVTSDPIPEKKSEVVSPPKEAESTSSKPEKIISDKKPSKSNNKKRKSSQKQSKTSGKSKSDSDSDECKPMKKKHRRIAVFDDSDSESEREDLEAQDKAQRSLWQSEEPMESESPIVPPTPDTDEDPIPPTPPVVLQKGRKKISKTVKKTFMDDEGFMVTTEEKEIVSESGSDEDPIPSKSGPSKEAAPKANQFTYRKQASLTNFFKKS